MDNKLTSELKKIIQDKYLHHGDYVLSSGQKSDKYFDIKEMLGNYRYSRMFIDCIDDFIDDKFNTSICLGGIELGGALIVASLIYTVSNVIDSQCFIRKRERQHGLKKMIEGFPVSPILLVDDVLSTGKTINDAIITCEDNGYDIAGVLCVVNRSGMNKLVWEGMKQKEYSIYSLFTEQEFE